ncbi:MAG: CYTH domain-containing protein [Thermodesulfobacteriota bacterium]|nr:CYTH domain-containing protein [Thermodesulfobacteriota bacterium]
MGIEIERKFLVKDDSWRTSAVGKKYHQGYLNSHKERTVRVRTIDSKGYLTIKGIAKGAVRAEYEYEIPVDDAREMLDGLCEEPLIEKTRYKVEHHGFVWEVDVFHGENQGLIIAELELDSKEQKFEKPEWIGAEVTGDSNYFNSNLIHHPYSQW